MFLKTKNQQNEDIYINIKLISSVLKQNDGDVFVHMINGDSYKVGNDFIELLKEAVKWS